MASPGFCATEKSTKLRESNLRVTQKYYEIHAINSDSNCEAHITFPGILCTIKIPCKICNTTYIGWTGRTFWALLQERQQKVTAIGPTWEARANPQQQSKKSQQSQTMTDPRDLFQPRHRLGPCQGDRQSKQQNGRTIDYGSDTHQERTRQVGEPRWGVLRTNLQRRRNGGDDGGARNVETTGARVSFRPAIFYQSFACCSLNNILGVLLWNAR